MVLNVHLQRSRGILMIGGRLDCMILEAFSNRGDSMTFQW